MQYLGLIISTLDGLWLLFCLVLRSRFKLRGPYWQWRLQTAFGKGYPPRAELFVSILEYARWTHQMKRGA